MKRSEIITMMEKYIRERTKEGWYPEECMSSLLDKIEEYGMLPPETQNCSDPIIYIKNDSPDAGFTIPTHFILGWDNEETK